MQRTPQLQLYWEYYPPAIQDAEMAEKGEGTGGYLLQIVEDIKQ